MNLAMDPIFKISVNEADAKFRSEYNGTMFYFCAACSKKLFDEHPQRYVNNL
jgi:YHS domain-containing protein